MGIGDVLAALPTAGRRRRRRHTGAEYGAMLVALVALPALHFTIVLYAELYDRYLLAFVILPALQAGAAFAVAERFGTYPSFRWNVALANVLLTFFTGSAAALLGVFGEIYSGGLF